MSNLTSRQLKTIELLSIDISKHTQRGWYSATCPFCGSSEKFGIKFNNEPDRKNHVSYNCFRGACGAKGTEFDLFKHLNKLHLLFDGEFIGNRETIDIKLKTLETVLPNIEVPVRYPPFGFKRSVSNDYLNSRGFVHWQYDQLVIGTTRLETKLRDYVIFLCLESGENRGYISRLTWNKEQSDEFAQKYGFEKLRYRNEAVDTGKILFGIDEVNENTEQVILVEGITDKANVDRLLQLNLSDTVKCLACFGKKVSDEQIIKLWTFGQNIKTVVLLFDAGTVSDSKQYSRSLSYWFDEILVGYMDGDLDPGSVSLGQLNDIMSSLRSPDQFDTDFLQIKLR